ncbi:MAG TPA: double-strand break repair helicase AddA [Alphaproteobacteria bacterium]|jgi:ATP-dependent helicase/nuclease subunit A|nr:double-strand break repair helicase AddA [Alphaproteobacteria bacterium]
MSTVLDPVREAERLQRLAADPNACVWVEASAGTGKTKTLTDRVLSLLLNGTPPSKILCLTFTRAAAAEMANRVSERLGAWARADEPGLKRALADLAGQAPDRARIARARRLFADVLEAPGGLRIQTIHGFCESVLKRFPVEAGLAPHFEVIDERTARELLDEARADVIGRARGDRADRGQDDGALARALGVIAERANEEQFSGLMESLARDHGRLGVLLEAFGGLDGLVAATAAALNLASDDTEASIRACACADGAYDHAGLRTVCEELANGSDADKGRGTQIAAFLEALAEKRVDLLEDYRDAFLTKDGSVRARLATKAVMTALGNRAEVLAIEARRLIEVMGRIKAARLLDGTRAMLTLGAALLDSYGALKEARAALDYDDLIVKTRALLGRPGVAPWVLFKLDGGIDHILVDEAQDTSPDQWAVIAAIADEFLAGEGARGSARTVFAVGDAKQSIYSFQRADPDAFAAMREHFRERAQGAGIAWRDLPLEVSFRSVAPVLSVVDSVFAQPPASDGVAGERPVRHRPAREGHGGRVELWPQATPPVYASPPAWMPPVTIARATSAPSRLADRIAEMLGTWQATGEGLPARGRAIRPSDVIVLVRQRTGFMEQLVRALKARDIPVAGVDRMVLSEQLVVQDLMALARFLLLPEDDLTLACLLKGPLIGLTEDELFAVAYNRPSSLWTSLKAKAAATRKGVFAVAEQRLSAWLARADYERPFELFARILFAEGGRARILARLGVEADDPLSEFLALALAYERTATPSLQDFIAWIDEGRAEIKRDLEKPVRDEVRVMTVHGAKGLQAPVVFLPDTTQVPGDRERLAWIDGPGGVKLPLWVPRKDDDDPVSARARAERVQRDVREYHRLLYVAMTRAEDRLVVAGCRPAKSSSTTNWYDMVRTGLADADDVTFEGDGFEGPARVVEARQQAKPKSDAEAQSAGVDAAVATPSWIAALPADESPPSRPITPSRFSVDAEDEEPSPPTLSPFDPAGPRFKRGLAVHRLLQFLPEIAEPQREGHARALAEGMGFAPEDAQRLAREVMGVLAHRELAALFGPGSLAEVPFAGRLGDGGPEIVGRLDRLVVSATEVIVADYKTNRPVARDAASVPRSYVRQMALYRAALLRSFPGRNVRCVLVYTDGPRVIELPATMLDAAISRGSAA